MYATELLMQMVGMASLDFPQVSTGGSSQNGGTSFQDLLEKQQASSIQGEASSSGSTPAEQPEQTPVTSGGNEDTSEQSPDLALLGAAFVMNPLPVAQNMMPAATEEESLFVIPAAESGIPVQMAAVPTTAAEQVPVQQPQLTEAEPETAVPTALPQEQVVTAAQSGDFGTAQEMQTDVQPQRSASQNVPDEVQVAEAGEAPLFPEMEHLPVKVSEPVTVDTTAPAKEVDASLAKVIHNAVEEGTQHLEIRLNPANLGSVEVEFTRTAEGAIHVVLRAETNQAAKILGDHAQNLGILLQDSTRSEVRVEVPQPQQNQQPWQQPDQNGGHQQQQQQQQRQAPRQEAETFLHQLRLGLVQTVPQSI